MFHVKHWEGAMYWDMQIVLSYGKNFNLICSPRKIGKTYTTQMFLIKQAIKKGREFVYVCRTDKELQQGILKKSFAKVITEQFPDYKFKFSKEEMIVKIDNVYTTLGYCIPLSMAEEAKKNSYPLVKYMLMDEYTLPKYAENKYVSGWREPDKLLSLYQTIDADRDEVVVFLLGNNYTFYNPYHLHPAFSIPFTEEGKIWCNDNVLFQRPVVSKDLAVKKSKTKFQNMIEGTEYGDHAIDGKYIDDVPEFIEKRTGNCTYICTMSYRGYQVGVWSGMQVGRVYIDDKVQESCPLIYALTTEDHKENTMLTRNKNNAVLKWLSRNFKLGNVRFSSQEVKTRFEKGIYLIL